MGKNQSASGLTNIVQYDTAGNISLVSGSTTLLFISSSGAITTTGVISGSNALSASYAASASNAISGAYAVNATTASYAANATTSSYSLTGTSSSYAINATTASYAVASTSGSYAINATTASYAVASTNAANATLFNSTASSVFATTGSNTLTGTQYVSNTNNATAFSNTTASIYTDGGLQITKDAYFSSSMFIKGNLTVFGTQSVSFISSSQLNIGTNLITVNTDTPSIRFGGLAVYDSGSSGLTGSILWDSQNNHWVYTNPSGSSYSGGMFISGPRASSLGSEQGTTLNAIMKGQGGDHITSSIMFESASFVGIGTSSPAYTLDVQGTGRFTGITTFGSTGGNGLRIYGAAGTNQWDMYLNSGNLRFSDNTGTGSVVFDRPISSTTGTFSGLLTTSAGINLPVNQAINSNSGRIVLNNGSIYLGDIDGVNPTGAVNIRQNGSDFLSYNSNTLTITGAAIFSSSANKRISTYTPSSWTGISDYVTSGVGWQFTRPNDNAFAHAIFTFNGTSTNNLAISSRSDLVIATGGGLGSADERMRITNDGNVGIGVTNPNRKLVVNSGIDGISAGIAGSTYGIRFDNGGTFSSGMSTIHGVDSTLTGTYQPIMINGSEVRFGTSATERVKITSGGQVVAPFGYQSFRGSISLTASQTAAIYTMPQASAADGVYYVYCRLDGGAAIYMASAIVTALAASSELFISNTRTGNNVALTVSGRDIRITNAGFGTFTWQWSILFQPVG
jgi:hypothetical protein